MCGDLKRIMAKMCLMSQCNNISVLFLAIVFSITAVRCVQGRAHSDSILENNSIPSRLFGGDSEPKSFSSDATRSLKRVFLSNRTITCNDGSSAGFYLRKSPGSQKWVVFFEGGWYCYDQKSCRTRWLRLRHLMTSAQWPEFREAGGILSPFPKENPHWHDANHILVPYCSSDSWTGRKIVPDSRDGWRFMGSLIVRQVIADLIPLGLSHNQGSELLLAGSSAGGLGVMLNLDKVRQFLQQEKKLKVLVRGVSDSGWFLDREPFVPNAISTSEVVQQGWKLWDGAVPEACRKKHMSEPWRCYFGHRVYPTLKSPLFIFQWLFDEAQMRADSVGAPVTPQQWNFIHEMGGALRKSLENVTAVFAPSCIGHSVLDKREWLSIRIDDISLADALRCWEISTENQQRKFTGKVNRKEFTKEERELRRKLNHQRQKRRRRQQQVQEFNQGLEGTAVTTNKQNNKKRKGPAKADDGSQKEAKGSSRARTLDALKGSDNNITVNQTFQRDQMNARRHKQQNLKNNRKKNPNKEKHHKKDKSNQHNRNKLKMRRRNDINKSLFPHHHHRHRGEKGGANSNRTEPKQCRLRLLEKCSWPQCNHSCPTLTNPVTGEEMRFLELLSSFGLDIEAVAGALGIDMQTLKNMGHAELVNLLTQQVS